MVISKIKYEFFYLTFLLFQIKNTYYVMVEEMKEKHKIIKLISRFQYA